MIEMSTNSPVLEQTCEGWSEQEHRIAQNAFQKAYQREIEALIRKVRDQASSLSSTDQVWQLHDFLSARRYELDGKYDFRCPSLLFVFAELVKEGWLSMQELEGLLPDKLAKIAALTHM